MARDYNALADAANMVFNTSASGAKVNIAPSGLTISTPDTTRHFPEPAQIAEAVNTGETDLHTFDAAQITPYGPWDWDNPDSEKGQLLSAPEFHTHRVLEICRPTEYCFGRFCICAENIPSNRVGRIYIGGACLCRICYGRKYWGTTQTDRADTVAGETFLHRQPMGTAQILWGLCCSESSSITWLAVMRFGHRSTSGINIQPRGTIYGGGVAEVIQLDESVTLHCDYAQGISEIRLK